MSDVNPIQGYTATELIAVTADPARVWDNVRDSVRQLKELRKTLPRPQRRKVVQSICNIYRQQFFGVTAREIIRLSR